MKITLHPSNNPQVEDIHLHSTCYPSADDGDIVIEYRNSSDKTIVSMMKEKNGDIVIEINSDYCIYEDT